MIIVKKGYFYIKEIFNYYSFNNLNIPPNLFNILQNLKQNDEEYISFPFFYDFLKEIKDNLTDLSGYFSINYFNFKNSFQEKKALEYFDYVFPKYCRGIKSAHLRHKEVNELLEKGYIVTFLGYYTTLNSLMQKHKNLFVYNKLIILDSKNPKNKKKMFLGAWK